MARPKGTLKGQRKQFQVRAFDYEIDVIKEFVKIVREDIEKAKALVEQGKR